MFIHAMNNIIGNAGVITAIRTEKNVNGVVIFHIYYRIEPSESPKDFSIYILF